MLERRKNETAQSESQVVIEKTAQWPRTVFCSLIDFFLVNINATNYLLINV